MMMMQLTVLALALSAVVLVAATFVRAARVADHRCGERRLPAECDRCAAAVRGDDRGGHLVCACGEASPHLFGAELLAWRAAHHDETLPPIVAVGPDVAVGSDGGQEPGSQAPRRTTRVRAAAAEEERIRQAMAQELDETTRRMISRARRKPDPITPQLLREAEQYGVRPEPQQAPDLDSADAQTGEGAPPSTSA